LIGRSGFTGALWSPLNWNDEEKEAPSYSRRYEQMNVSRKLGILVFCAVPAIVGGGIIYALFHSYAPVLVYEILLLLTAGMFLSR